MKIQSMLNVWVLKHRKSENTTDHVLDSKNA